MAKNTLDNQNEAKPKDPRNESKFVAGEPLPPVENEPTATQPSDSAIKEASENALRVHNEAKQHESDQATQNAATEIAQVVARTMQELDGKILITTKIGEEETTQELGDSQSEGFNRYKTLEWNDEAEAESAKAITLYSFGIGDKEAFEDKVSGLSEEEAKAFYKIAKKLDLGVVTKKHFKDLQDEEED